MKIKAFVVVALLVMVCCGAAAAAADPAWWDPPVDNPAYGQTYFAGDIDNNQSSFNRWEVSDFTTPKKPTSVSNIGGPGGSGHVVFPNYPNPVDTKFVWAKITRKIGVQFPVVSLQLESGATTGVTQTNTETVGAVLFRKWTIWPQPGAERLRFEGGNGVTDMQKIELWTQCWYVPPVPEPSSVLTLALGVPWLLATARRRRSGNRSGPV